MQTLRPFLNDPVKGRFQLFFHRGVIAAEVTTALLIVHGFSSQFAVQLAVHGQRPAGPIYPTFIPAW
ncbi:hypothetical protein ACT3TS_15135 [Specibacter sp. AOP5-B1-6]|uniref:hypothetical protein n=1 Tax=Specibacter sp. AOP5-B1-6 TaxID=3457653 RepID=UPI00402B7891